MDIRPQYSFIIAKFLTSYTATITEYFSNSIYAVYTVYLIYRIFDTTGPVCCVGSPCDMLISGSLRGVSSLTSTRIPDMSSTILERARGCQEYSERYERGVVNTLNEKPNGVSVGAVALGLN